MEEWGDSCHIVVKELLTGSFGMLTAFFANMILNCEMCSLENQPGCSMKMYSERVLTM